jgi:hypothetical protein
MDHSPRAFLTRGSPTFAGERFTAIASPRRNETTVKIAKLWARLTRKVFMRHATIPVGVLKDLLSKEEYPDFVTTDQTGYRTITTVASAAVAEAGQQ